MKHFSDEIWTDFVRGVGPSNINREIEAHIAGGCLDCTASWGMWTKVYSIAGNESTLTPPDHAVRMAKLEFSANQLPLSESVTLATLVFDSLSQRR